MQFQLVREVFADHQAVKKNKLSDGIVAERISSRGNTETLTEVSHSIVIQKEIVKLLFKADFILKLFEYVETPKGYYHRNVRRDVCLLFLALFLFMIRTEIRTNFTQ